MSSETTKNSIPFVEILAIMLFVVGIIFIFVSGSGKEDKEREVRNALRFQNVSEIANTLWKISLTSTEYSNLLINYPKNVLCPDSMLTVNDFTPLLVPQYFETIPQDPNGQPYKVSFDENNYITVCSPWGEEENGEVKVISITR